MTEFPLSAIVGQEPLVEALLVCAVDPGVGGVLVRGERGTAKSTAVRGLAALLPDGPLVEVPLGTTLDRLVGSLDLGRALQGEAAYEAGLLVRADRGVLYVDEVNLLPDHLVDALLDAAATGVCRVEREAVSVVHDARFLLVGTMNAEEGELRPQLLDRFGLGVDVVTPVEPAVRAEVVRRRLAFEADREGFAARFAVDEARIRGRIARARTALDGVALPERELLRITGACAALGLDGVRGDVVCARAARVLAALDGAAEVTEDHVRRAALLALAHRRRRDPLEPPASGTDAIEQAVRDAGPPPPPDDDPAAQHEQAAADRCAQQTGPGPDRRVPDAERAALRERVELAGRGSGPAGRRGRGTTGAIDSRPAAGGDVAVVPSLLAGAPREHVRGGREGSLLVLVADASGSMAARARLARVKGALLDLLRDAYARRDRVAIVAFRDDGASLVAAPGASPERAAAAVRELPAGGRTPLAAGLDLAADVIARERTRDRDRRALCVVLTDGRARDEDGAAQRAARRLGGLAQVHLVDTEEGPVRLGMVAALATAAGATVTTLTTTRSAA